MVKEAEKCMKCGFCMSACPIYKVEHIETHVARGRNMLINMASKENIILTDTSYKDAIYYCILCGRCQSVCPAKVSSVDISIKARNEFINQNGLSVIQYIIYRWILSNRETLAKFIKFLSYIPGLSTKKAPPLRHLSDSFFIFSGSISIPKISLPFLPKRIAPENINKKAGKIAIFPGCAFEFFLSYIGEKIIQALRKIGFNVIYPYGLSCCGFPIYSAGDIKTAKKIAKKNIDILYGYEKIVTGCATCVSALKAYKDWFDKDEDYMEKARYVSSRTRGFSEFIIEEQIKLNIEMPNYVTVTYHDPCHMKWHQGIYNEPREIIGSIKKIKFVEMENADMCCGLGGSFGITHRNISFELQNRKIKSIIKTNSSIVATECPGCIIQIQNGIKKHHLPIRVAHISELLVS